MDFTKQLRIIFNYIQKKHGEKYVQQIRELETLKLKLVRITCDIKLTKNCKNNAVIPTFAKVNNGAVSNNNLY